MILPSNEVILAVSSGRKYASPSLEISNATRVLELDCLSCELIDCTTSTHERDSFSGDAKGVFINSAMALDDSSGERLFSRRWWPSGSKTESLWAQPQTPIKIEALTIARTRFVLIMLLLVLSEQTQKPAKKQVKGARPHQTSPRKNPTSPFVLLLSNPCCRSAFPPPSSSSL